MRTRFCLLLAVATSAACARTPPLLSPDPRRVEAVGPDSFTVAFATSRGAFDVKVHRDWSPRGSDRLYYLFKAHYYDGVRFFRTVDHFVTQFGINGNTAVNGAWHDRKIADDPVARSNVRGTLTFATGGPNTRTTQLFINYRDNSRLDRSGFAVMGQVVIGMPVVDSLYKGYGEGAPRGEGPSQERIGKEGNAYLIRDFPKLDYIITARVDEEWRHR